MSELKSRPPTGGAPPGGSSGVAAADRPAGGGPCQWNSSITRVRPFFRALFANDGNGQGWLPQLLGCATTNLDYAQGLAQNPGNLIPGLLDPRDFPDSCWKRVRGVKTIRLESCFEKKLPPPERFLLWMIQHPDRLAWPLQRRRPPVEKTFAPPTQEWREKFKGRHGLEAIELAKHQALRQLIARGASGSTQCWWAFEGHTHIDCYLETENFILVIEGKRTETLAAGVEWFPQRNQLWRNLEVTSATARGKPFALLLIAENHEAIENASASLPHFTPEEQAFLEGHFLGCITCRQACQATGIDFGDLPDTIERASP
jgi:hypothetical protein